MIKFFSLIVIVYGTLGCLTVTAPLFSNIVNFFFLLDKTQKLIRVQDPDTTLH
jgi:hypothetical protein